MTSNKNEYFYKLGYDTFGPILSSYLSWIINRYRELDLDVILCASRDGFIIDKSIKKIEPEIGTSYFYTSRLASVIPLLSSRKDLFSMLNLYKSWPDEFNVSLVLERLGIVIANEELNKIGIDTELNFNKYDLKNNNQYLIKVFEIFKEQIYTNSNYQKDLLIKYLSQFFGKKIGFVDLGAGTIFSSLILFCKENNLEIEFYSLYFQSNNKEIGFCNMRNARIKSLFRMCYILLEIFFTAPHSSVLNYKKGEGDNIVPVFSKKIYNLEVLSALHDGAVQYLSENYSSEIDNPFKGLYTVGLYPRETDINNLGKILIDVNSFNQSLLSSIDFKKKDSLQKLKSSLWLSGQLKSLGLPNWIIRIFQIAFYIKYKLIKN